MQGSAFLRELQYLRCCAATPELEANALSVQRRRIAPHLQSDIKRPPFHNRKGPLRIPVQFSIHRVSLV